MEDSHMEALKYLFLGADYRVFIVNGIEEA